MRYQHVDDENQCRLDATRRVLRRVWRPAGPRPSGVRGDRLLGPGLQAARPRPPAVDAAATSSRFRADRRTSEAVAPGSPVRVSDGVRDRRAPRRRRGGPGRRRR